MLRALRTDQNQTVKTIKTGTVRSPIRIVGFGLVAGTTMLLSACSGSFSVGGQSPSDAAVALIEGDLADQLGEELSASCPTIDRDADVGTEFVCTAVSPSGETFTFDADLAREDFVNVAIRDEGQAAATTLPVTEDPTTSVEPAPVDEATTSVVETTTDEDDGDTGGIDNNTALSDLAIGLIQTTLADELGLTLTATCEDVPLGAAVGTEFACTATTGDNELVELAGVVDSEDHVNVETTNVIAASAIEAAIEQPIAETASGQLGKTVTTDCGEVSIVLDDSRSIDCVLIDDAGAEIPIVVSEIDAVAGTFRFDEK